MQKVTLIPDAVLEQLVPLELVLAHRERSLTPDRPVIRGTAQNPDVYFQGRETVNRYYYDCADAVQQAMDEFAALTGRQYKVYEYHGAPDAERVIVLMGSGCETAHETVDYLTAQGEKVGILKVRMYRPFDSIELMKALPQTVQAIAVLDRTKEPGAPGEPLYLDVVHAIHELPKKRRPRASGRRRGKSSLCLSPHLLSQSGGRTLRALVQGIHPGDGQERLRQFGPG